jgi:FKBP-type peptidyl-prolyl cis-trans isomerase (trigger factor)
MKINIKQKNDSLIEFSVKLKWEDIEKDYVSEQNKIISESKQKGARKGKLVGVQREIFIFFYKDYINSNFVDSGLNIYYRQALEEKKNNSY